MREIKFRGKRVDNGKWVYGDLIQNSNNGVLIVYQLEHMDGLEYHCVEFEVDPQTVGQYTGVNDVSGSEIYEGDIVNTYPFHTHRVSKTYKYQKVIFLSGEFKAEHSDYGWEGETLIALNHCTVVGNIYENEELLDNK